MASVRFERLVSRNISIALSKELDKSGMKASVESIIRVMVIGFLSAFIISAFSFYLFLQVSTVFKLLVSFFGGLGVGAVMAGMVYLYIEYKIDQRKTKMESILPDYLQIASANLRSGISLDRAMLLAARPEFGFFSEDIIEMNKRIFGGENFADALQSLASKYKSYELTHAIRMIIESMIHGGAMADLLDQLSKDIRNQQLTQKEVAGQLFLYSIFIAFAGLIASPVLYGLTSQMISVTDTVWAGILQSNPGGLPSTGLSFLRPSPPKITIGQYRDFSLGAIIIITGFASLIMSAISSGSAIKGLKYVPVFIGIGIIIFFMMHFVLGGLFSSIGGPA